MGSQYFIRNYAMVRKEGRGEDRRQLGREAESGMRWLLKRWWFWGGTGFILVVVVAGYLLIPVGDNRISQANCDRIQLGWSRKQVQELLGRVNETNSTAVFDNDGKPINLPSVWTWRNEEEDTIHVAFDQSGAIEKDFAPSSLSLWDRMKRRIERRIRAFWP